MRKHGTKKNKSVPSRIKESNHSFPLNFGVTILLFIFGVFSFYQIKFELNNFQRPKMSSDEEDNDDDYLTKSSSSSSLSANRIASAILFGNIDENGELTDNIFDDDECRRHIDSLKPHLSSIISYEDIIENDDQDDDDDNDSKQRPQSDNNDKRSSDDDGKGMFGFFQKKK